MDEHVLTATRLSLHAVAEQLLAGPQHRAKGTIRLRVTPGGFACIPQLMVDPRTCLHGMGRSAARA
jgi:hypothetical protein